MPPIDRTLLDKYITGACSQEEEEMVHHWLDDNDLDDYPADLHSEIRYKQKEKNGWRQLLKRIDELQPAMVKSHFLKHVSVPRFTQVGLMWKAAATIAVLVALSVFLYQSGFQAHYESKYETTFGEIKRVSLADGTIVTLNAQSTLKVENGFNEKSRTVYLEGEAFFEVKKHTGKPFTVETGKVNVTALGTSFDVSDFKADPEISVALKNGKVAVNTASKKARNRIILKPGEGVVYNKKDLINAKIKQRFNPKERLAWQHQVIYFKNAGMREVISKLQRFYGVEVTTDGLADRDWQLSGEYKSETLEHVLESLSFNYGLKYKIEGNRVVLYGK